MFTGIVESIGTVINVESQGTNRTFWVQSSLSDGFKVDQSVSHSGVCLTVEETRDGAHRVTAIHETLIKTNLGQWEAGTQVNLERCLQLNARLDGHMVQGHTDTTAICTLLQEKDGSQEFTFEFPPQFAPLLIEKGSVAVNGISLTAFNVSSSSFTVAIIPYTFQHTNLHAVKKGHTVNIEFDMIGKYILRKLTIGEVR